MSTSGQNIYTINLILDKNTQNYFVSELQLVATGQYIDVGDDPVLNAVAYALYNTLLSKGIQEEIGLMKQNLIRFIQNSKKYSENFVVDAIDFDQYKISCRLS